MINPRLKKLLEDAISFNASDIHITPNHKPSFRINGKLEIIKGVEEISEKEAEEIAFELMGEKKKEKFLEEKEIDFSFKYKDDTRFRVNSFFQEDTISSALRIIPKKIPTIDELGLPQILHKFILNSQGFIIVTGSSSQGKSTTLAAMLNEISKTRSEHIITIEDPIEYMLEDNGSIVNQREVGRDTNSFKKALKAAFRQDPDVIMIGEMRDPETIETAITAAETGHFVFATLHTNSAFQTIHRIVDSFPSSQQNQIRAQLSGSLIAVISQRLVPRIKGGLIPVCEIMINNPAIGNLIRENKIHEIPLVIETSTEIGMMSQNRHLVNLVKAGEIDIETAKNYSQDPEELIRMI